MKIGIDIDNVLSELSASMDLWHNRVHGTNLEEKDHVAFDLESIWTCSKEESIKKILEFFDSSEFKATKIVLGAIEGVKSLTEDHELHVITSRADKVFDETIAWLNKHFSDSFHKVHFTGQMCGAKSGNRSKAMVCKEYGINILIEDALHYANNCANEGVKVLLFDWPWNQSEELHPNIIRVKSWQEILDYIENIHVL